MAKTFGNEIHLCDSVHHYSLKDLVHVENGSLVEFMMKATNTLISHIVNCDLCKAKGFFCEFCNHNEILFPFQLKKVVQCQHCKSFFHRKCYVQAQCPKCMRMEGYRLRNIAHASSSTHDLLK